MTDLRLIVYVSCSAQTWGTQELDNLLALSRVNNASVGVTGMLLYHEGNFMQALEGPPDAVEHVYERVKHDPRHYGLIKMVDEAAEARRFEMWSMGFHRPEANHTPDGWSDFLSTADEADPQGDVALKILGSFRKNLR
jgi:hypothetical protein